MEGERNRSALPLTPKCTIYYIDILLADLSGLFGKTDLEDDEGIFCAEILDRLKIYG